METKLKPKIIFDTDIGGDCDDAGTLAMLHRLCDKGEAELLAVTHCNSSPYLAGCIGAINRFYGREVPVGINYSAEIAEGDVYAKALCESFPHGYASEDYMKGCGAPDTLTVLRETLSRAEDGSVTLVVTGKLDSMLKLVRSPADGISPLTGKELIERKISRTVLMGGRFFETWPMAIYPDGRADGEPVRWEWNIKYGGEGVSRAAIDEWPGKLVFSSYEIGSYIETMRGYPDRAGDGDPVALAYNIHNGGKGRCSWDQTAMLEAVRPSVYWNYHEYGRITVDDDFVTHWSPDEKRRHTYLLPKVDYEDIRAVIDSIVDGE